MHVRIFFLLLFSLTSFTALSSSLSVNISDGLPKEVLQNINAYLGGLPKSDNERSAFIYSAKKKTQNALKALGYYQSVVTTSVSKDLEKNVWTLSITIQLNQPTLVNHVKLEITGEAKNDPAFISFKDDIPISNGDKLHHGIYEKLKSNLTSLGLERGYFNSKFTLSTIAINKNLQTADIDIHFESGARYKFGQVDFSDINLNYDVLQPLIPFQTGDYYQSALIQNFQNALDETHYFGNVVVHPKSDSNINDLLPVEVSLNKAKSHEIDLGIGYATDTKARFSLGWKTPLINRFGHRQESRFSYSTVNPTGRFIYSIPLTHANNDVLRLQALLEENDYADITSRYMSFQVGRVYLEKAILRQPYMRYLIERWSFDGVEYNANYLIPGLTWSDTKREGNLLDPSNGFREYYSVEASHKDLSSAASFIRLNARWNYISLIAPNHRLVTRAELGYILADKNIGAELSPSLRFYAGGDQSIRGFAYQSVGPTVTYSHEGRTSEEFVTGGTNLVVASIEYQYYFSNEWRGALFFDTGSVNNTNKLNLVYSVGPAMHYMSAIGPIRFALGYPLSEEDPSWRVHFSLGAEL